ncbi:MAG: putative addiction module antidote protein [Campylobacterales bacterium]|nr:putative addiction module antidote protein [Campylobacterales bacterium]
MISDFDISEYLDDRETITEYLNQVLLDGDMNEILDAIGNIAKAKGIAQIAKDTGLGRESLYKTFSKDAKPRFETVMRVLKSLDIRLQVG